MAAAIGEKMKQQNAVIAQVISAVTGARFEEEGDEEGVEETEETAPDLDYKAILARQTAHLQGN